MGIVQLCMSAHLAGGRAGAWRKQDKPKPRVKGASNPLAERKEAAARAWEARGRPESRGGDSWGQSGILERI